MIDWKYGFIKLLSYIPFILAWITWGYFQRPILGTIFFIVYIIGLIFLSNKLTFQNKYHSATLKHFDGIFRVILMIVAILIIWLLPDSIFNLIMPFIITAADIVPAFFTKRQNIK